jgi:hypothetical protein
VSAEAHCTAQFDLVVVENVEILGPEGVPGGALIRDGGARLPELDDRFLWLWGVGNVIAW